MNMAYLQQHDRKRYCDNGDGEADDGSLRGSTEIVAGRIKDEIQSNYLWNNMKHFVKNIPIIMNDIFDNYLEFVIKNRFDYVEKQTGK